MSKAFRDLIVEDARAIEGSVINDLTTAKNVNWNFISSDLSVENMPRDRFIQTYVTMKSDCIALQIAYRDIILRQKVNTHHHSSIENQTDLQLIEFEKKYRNLNINVNTEEKLTILLDLYETREKMKSKIGNSLYEQQLGLDHMIAQSTTEHPIYTMCSKDIINYLSVLRTFRKYLYI